ncbi:M13 family metallopeptidase [Sphingomonas sp.]|uniref:M13 family metallopeptidase n=1 Tax=Sphingomonas sp. TaxID=28214 RepID=UPI00286E2DED|nr:M13 family metallopeptidase [Sphingomonas sp.]
MTRFCLLGSAALLALGCPAFAQTPAADSEPAPMQFPGWGADPADLDRAVKPGDDFDAFVNGKWKAANEIPAKYPYYGVTTNLRIGAERQVRAIIDELAARQNPPGSLEQRVADMYRAYLDTAAINAAGMAPAKPYLDRIAAVASYDDLADLWATNGYPAPLGEFVSIDRGDPTRNTLFVGLGGLGLPDRDNYLVDNPRNIEMRGKYLELVTFLLGKAGHADPKAGAAAVYALEKQMAAVLWDRAVARNPQLTTNRLSHAELLGLSGNFPLKRYLDARGILPTDSFNVLHVLPSDDEAKTIGLTAAERAKLGGGFPGMLALAMATPLDTWKTWMTVRLLSGGADLLPSDIDNANFAFFGKYLQGREKQRDRWQRAVSEVEGNVGEALGKIYVERHFPPASKAAMEELVGNLRLAMAENLKDLAWMTPATRAAAKAKLDALTVKIGYPDKFETYDGLAISARDPITNRLAAAQWQWAKDLDDLRKPVDRDKWLLTPQTVNAYYMPTANDMAYPAAYLQAPNFSPTADAAVNYGAIGATIGHEIGHGFDDNGSRYDGSGTLNNWWTPEDKATFDKLGARLAAQYDAICPFDGGKTCVNGKLTLGENIGDLGGLSMAYKAYHLSLKGKPAPVIDGLTGDQRFFISYAQHQRTEYRDAFLRQLMQTDPHSPDFARINAVLRNFDPWYAAFKVQPGDKLYMAPAQRVRIW